MRLLLIFLIFFNANISNAKLQFKDFAKNKSNFNEFSKIYDPHTGTVIYQGLNLISFLNKNIKNWQASNFIRFTSDDGYQVDVPVDRIIRYKPFLAIGIKDKRKFEFFDVFQNKVQSLSPGYLVWDSKKYPELRNESTFYWPYRIYTIETANKNLLEGNDDSLFKKKCGSCHRDQEFGIVPQIIDVKKSVQTMNNIQFKKFLNDPKSVDPKSKMPAVDLTDQERREIYLWLTK